MRIAVIAPLVAPLREPHLGGAQTHLLDVALGLTRRGHDVDVYAASGSSVAGLRIVDTGVDAESLRASLFRLGRGPVATGAAGAAFTTVCRAVDAGDYQLAHNHAFDAPAMRAAITIRAPVVHTLHLPPDPVVAEAVRQAQASTRPPTIVAVSRSHAASWRAVVRVDAVLRPGVPVAHIPWRPTAGAGLLFAGRLSPEKGALEAIEIAVRAGVAIDLYGNPYDDQYTVRVEACRGRPGVGIHAAAERALLWDLMSRAAAVLCPSTWEEPFGLVAAEANAAGTPVVAFRSGALPEVVADGVTGVVVDPGDVVAAAAAVPVAMALDRRACRGHAERDLDLETSLDAHEALYSRLVDSGDAASS